MLDAVLKAELIPVLAPVAYGEDGKTYNVNADTFAGAIAGAIATQETLKKGLDIEKHLNRNDSYGFFKKTAGLDLSKIFLK